jgi:multimeric flavodoxin WrbA
MKVLLINGSPHSKGNTHDALEVIAKELTTKNVPSEIIQLGGINIRGCQGCQMCWKNKNQQCIMKDDLAPIMTKCFDRETKAIVIASPTYFSNVTTEIKAFIDRVGYVAKANDGLLKHKIGAPVVIDRRAGANFVYSAINFFFGINEMPIATSSYWNGVKARKLGDLINDLEGIETLKTLASNIVRLINK